MWATLALLLTLAGGFSAWHYYRRRRVLQLGVYFNICAIAYMVFGLIMSWSLMRVQYESELQQIAWMCIAALGGFNVAYLLASFRRASVPEHSREYLPTHTSLIVFVLAGCAFQAAAVLITGPWEFLLVERVSRFGMFQQLKQLFYVANLTNVCLPVVLMRYIRFGQRRDLRLLIFLLVHGSIWALLTISRYDMTIILLAAGYVLERHRRIRPSLLLGLLIAGLGSTLFFKPTLYSVLLGLDYHVPVDFGEYVNWIRNTILLLSSPEVQVPHNGYGLTLKSLMVMSPSEHSLSEWYLREFFWERLILFPGTSYGFSGVLEGYLANGLMGIAVHFAFFGAVFGWLERSPGAMRQVFTIFALILTYRLFRSESYNFVKTYAWYFAYPTLAIVVADKFLSWASGARPGKPANRPARQRPAFPTAE